MHEACEHCPRAHRIPRSIDETPGTDSLCLNCAELGQAGGVLKTTTELGSSTAPYSVAVQVQEVAQDSPRCSFPSCLGHSLACLARKLCSQAFTFLLAIAARVFHIILLGFPAYYFNRGAEFIEQVDRCAADYEIWTNTLRKPAGSPTQLDSGGVEEIPLPEIGRSRPSESTLRPDQETDEQSDESHASSGQYAAYPPRSASNSSPSNAQVPQKVIHMQAFWDMFVDSRVAEWKYMFTAACVFIAASPTVFQIPQAGDDPMTRWIAFLAIGRAISGLIYSPIFPLYLRYGHTRTVHYARLWAENVQRNGKTSEIWNPWVMLSLPAAAVCWAMIFFMFAIFSFIWRSGSTADEDVHPHPLSVHLAIAVRVAITGLTTMDLICMVTIWITLRKYEKTYAARLQDLSNVNYPSVSPNRSILAASP